MLKNLVNLLSLLAVYTATVLYAQAPTCPAATDAALPKGTGVYIQSGKKWASLSNPTLWQCHNTIFTFCNWGSFRFASSAAYINPSYLTFNKPHAAKRTKIPIPIFLVRGYPTWNEGIFLQMDIVESHRQAPLSGRMFELSKLDASIELIEDGLVCVKPNKDLTAGEYVLVLAPKGSMPTTRDNFWDFGID